MDIVQSIEDAHRRILPYILQTPLEYSPAFSELTGAEVWLKLEHIQTTGSFKLRGAANFLLSLSPEVRALGVITASTGNHGAAVAYIAQRLDITCTVYLPDSVAPTKLAFLQRLGAETLMVPGDPIQSELTARAEAVAQGRPFISPYNDLSVIHGQGTLGLELVQQAGELDALFVPVGGGGLVSGVAGYLKGRFPTCEIVGCQPQHSAIMFESMQAGEIVDIPSLPTLSDGTAGGLEPGSITFDFCRQWVDRWALVSEAEIKHALLKLLEEHYLLVEGAAGLGLASLLKDPSSYQGKKVGLILCGRKLGLNTLKDLLDSP